MPRNVTPELEQKSLAQPGNVQGMCKLMNPTSSSQLSDMQETEHNIEESQVKPESLVESL